MYVSMYVCMDGWMDGWMKEWMEGWMDGWMDVQYMDKLFKPLSMSCRPAPASPEFQCCGFVALFLIWGLILFVHSKKRTKQENNIDIWGEGVCSMYRGLNNSSIYDTGSSGQHE